MLLYKVMTVLVQDRRFLLLLACCFGHDGEVGGRQAMLAVSALGRKVEKGLSEVEFHLWRTEQIETESVVRRRAVFADSLTMHRCRIAFVLVPMIDGIFFVKPRHAVVPVCLCQNACRGNAHVLAVALDDSSTRQIVVWAEAVSVDDNLLRPQFEPVEGTVHGKYAGTKNVDAVYFFIIDNANRPCQRLTLNHFTQGIAFLLAQLLRVVQHLAFEVGRQDNCCGKYRPRKASATGFVATGLNNIFMMEWQKHRLIS